MSARIRCAVAAAALVACLATNPVSAVGCGPWIALNLSQDVERAQPTDIYDVVYLVAPLLECTEGSLLSWGSAYHGGIAFRNRRSLDAYTVNFDAFPSFTGAIAPTIEKLANGTFVLKWQNTGATFIYAGINATYWTTYNKVVGEINGTVFNEFMFGFMPKTNTTFHYYNIWSVYDRFPGRNFVPNQECFYFAWQSFKELARLGSPVAAASLPQSFVAIYTADMPPKVDVSDQVQLQNMQKWYIELENDLTKKGYLGYFEALWELLWKEVFYVRDNSFYYKVKLHYPYLSTHYVDVPTPRTATDTCGGVCA